MWYNLTRLYKDAGKSKTSFNSFSTSTLRPYANHIGAKIMVIKGGPNSRKRGTFTDDERIVDRVKEWLNPKSFTSFKRAEHQFYDDIVSNMFSGYEIIPQFQCDGYFIDWYIPELKLAIEFDEPAHNNKLSDDTIRQKYIENKLNCKFLRYTYEY